MNTPNFRLKFRSISTFVKFKNWPLGIIPQFLPCPHETWSKSSHQKLIILTKFYESRKKLCNFSQWTLLICVSFFITKSLSYKHFVFSKRVVVMMIIINFLLLGPTSKACDQKVLKTLGTWILPLDKNFSWFVNNAY